jgi:hypothetical protein
MSASLEHSTCYESYINNSQNLKAFCACMKRKYYEFFSVSLDPGLPPRSFHDYLRKLGAIYQSEYFSGDVDVERLNHFFLSRPISLNVPEFSFVLVTEDQTCNAVISITTHAGVGEIPLCFLKSLLLV